MITRIVVYLLASIGLVVWYRHQASVNLTPTVTATATNAASLPTPIPGPERIAAARALRQKVIAERCKTAGLPYPPRELFLRAFKREAELEVWGREDRGKFRRIGLFAVTASSGQPGPKRREGDLQVPEGCYRINVFNPESSFHLSLGIDYPNASDRILSDAKNPGFDIYIHGGAVSIGCLPLGDDGIDEVFLLAQDVKTRGQIDIPVHIFPARMAGEGWNALQ